MNQKALKTLEYDKIINQLTEYAASPLGKALCQNLSPSSDLEEVRTWQAQTTDAVTRIRLKGSVSFSGIRDIGDSLKRLDIGSSLSITELLSISSLLTVAARAKAYGRHDGEDDAGQNDDRSLQTHRRIAFQEALADVLRRLSGKGRKWNRGERCVHVHFEKAAIDAQNHHEGQHPNEQSTDKRHSPQGNGLKEAAILHRRDDLLRQHRCLWASKAGRIHDRTDHALDNFQNRHHQLHAVGNQAFSNRKTDEQLHRVLRLFQLCKGTAGFHNSHHKEQNQQSIADGL